MNALIWKFRRGYTERNFPQSGEILDVADSLFLFRHHVGDVRREAAELLVVGATLHCWLRFRVQATLQVHGEHAAIGRDVMARLAGEEACETRPARGSLRADLAALAREVLDPVLEVLRHLQRDRFLALPGDVIQDVIRDLRGDRPAHRNHRRLQGYVPNRNGNW